MFFRWIIIQKPDLQLVFCYEILQLSPKSLRVYQIYKFLIVSWSHNGYLDHFFHKQTSKRLENALPMPTVCICFHRCLSSSSLCHKSCSLTSRPLYQLHLVAQKNPKRPNRSLCHCYD